MEYFDKLAAYGEKIKNQNKKTTAKKRRDDSVITGNWSHAAGEMRPPGFYSNSS